MSTVLLFELIWTSILVVFCLFIACPLIIIWNYRLYRLKSNIVIESRFYPYIAVFNAAIFTYVVINRPVVLIERFFYDEPPNPHHANTFLYVLILPKKKWTFVVCEQKYIILVWGICIRIVCRMRCCIVFGSNLGRSL